MSEAVSHLCCCVGTTSGLEEAGSIQRGCLGTRDGDIWLLMVSAGKRQQQVYHAGHPCWVGG